MSVVEVRTTTLCRRNLRTKKALIKEIGEVINKADKFYSLKITSGKRGFSFDAETSYKYKKPKFKK